MSKIVYCADVIARMPKNSVVIVERLGSIKGYALPGGKQETLNGEAVETLGATATREFKEETGLDLVIEYVLGTYAKPGRDPRGNSVSTVFVGRASGTIKDEPNKTRTLVLPELQVKQMSLVFDHSKIFHDYLSLPPR